MCIDVWISDTASACDAVCVCMCCMCRFSETVNRRCESPLVSTRGESRCVDKENRCIINVDDDYLYYVARRHVAIQRMSLNVPR